MFVVLGFGDVTRERAGHREVRVGRTTKAALRVLEVAGGLTERVNRVARQAAHHEDDPARQTPDGPRELGAVDHGRVERRVRMVLRLDDLTVEEQRSRPREVEEQVDRRELRTPL